MHPANQETKTNLKAEVGIFIPGIATLVIVIVFMPGIHFRPSVKQLPGQPGFGCAQFLVKINGVDIIVLALSLIHI